MVVAMATGSIFAAPSYLTKDSNGGYMVTYDYTDKAKSGWYVTGRAELSLLSWKNTYSADGDWLPDASFETDKYSLEPIFGGSLAFGRTFNYFWRAELEAGILGAFRDKEPAAEFNMTLPYAMLNGYYDFVNGLYLGVGVGAAMPITTIDGIVLLDDNRKETKFSFMAGLMFGYTKKLDDNLVLDLRYRLAGLTGFEHKVNFEDLANVSHWANTEVGMILDNSVSIGLRYEF